MSLVGLFLQPLVVQSPTHSGMAVFIQFHDHTAPGWEKTEQSPGSVTEEILDGHEKGHDQRHNLQENGPCHGQRPDTGCIVAKPGKAAWHWMKRYTVDFGHTYHGQKPFQLIFLWFLWFRISRLSEVSHLDLTSSNSPKLSANLVKSLS